MNSSHLLSSNALHSSYDISRYLDDVRRLEGELYGGLVLSQHAHAIISVDASAALVMEGVVDYVSVTDVPGDNMIGLSLSREAL